MTIPAMSPEYIAAPPAHVRRGILARIEDRGAHDQARGVTRAACPYVERRERAAWLTGHFLSEARR